MTTLKVSFELRIGQGHPPGSGVPPAPDPDAGLIRSFKWTMSALAFLGVATLLIMGIIDFLRRVGIELAH